MHRYSKVYYMDEKYFTISEAAKKLGVSIDTLRRWDKTGKIVSIRKTKKGNRYYKKNDIEKVCSEEYGMASEWSFGNNNPTPPTSPFYCQNSAIFQAKLSKLATLMDLDQEFKSIAPLLIAVAGEIGNNSFDHNLGAWPDVPGIFFGYNLENRKLVLADRGQGIYHTLKRVKPELANHQEALYTAFTEIITGRAPEKRGNGLKFVKQAITDSAMELFFQTGDASLSLDKSDELLIEKKKLNVQGCLAFIIF